MAQVSQNNITIEGDNLNEPTSEDSNYVSTFQEGDNLNPTSEDVLDESYDSNFQEDIDLESSLPLEVSIDDSQNELDETLEEIEEEEEEYDDDNDDFHFGNAGAEIKIENDELDH